MIYFNADIRRAHARSDDSITSGSVGIPVALALDSAFDGLAKTLCFKTATASVDIALVGDTTESTVPPDVISTAGEWLYIGIYAADGDGNIVIPTVWANAGKIEQGTIPSGVDPSEPTPSWVAQVQNIASEALETANSVREDADSGKFDGEPGEAGTNGTTFIPSVDAAGNISWTNDGGLPNPEPRNIRGPKGEKLTYADLTPADKADLVQGPIAEAQTAAVAAVNQAGTTQTGNVNAVGAAQVQAVEDKGAEVLESIPADYTELSEDVADLKSAINTLQPAATAADMGKALIVKTVDTQTGKPTSYEYGEAGGESTASRRYNIPSGSTEVLPVGTLAENVPVEWVLDGGDEHAFTNGFKAISGRSFPYPLSGSWSSTGKWFNTSQFGADLAANTVATGEAPYNVMIVAYHLTLAEGVVVDLRQRTGTATYNMDTGTEATPTSGIKESGWYVAVVRKNTDDSDSNNAYWIFSTSSGTKQIDYLYAQNSAWLAENYSAYGDWMWRQASDSETLANNFFDLFNQLPIVPGENFTPSSEGSASASVTISGSTTNYTQDDTTIAIAENATVKCTKGAVKFGITVKNANGIVDTALSTESTYPVQNKVVTQKFEEVQARGLSLKGKTFAVIGDSIGTWQGHNVPEMTITEDDVGVELESYVTYYDVNPAAGNVQLDTIGGTTVTSEMIGTEITFTPVVADVGKMIGQSLAHGGLTRIPWWKIIADKYGMICNNASWSGTSITSHEASSDTYKCSYAWHEDIIRKCGTRTPGTMTREAPDYIFIARGTNDFSHGPVAKLSDDYFASGSWSLPVDDTVTGGYGLKEGLVLTISKLREAYPASKIFVCTCTPFARFSETVFPPKNGTNTLPQFNQALREVAEYMSCPIVPFDTAWSFEQLSTYTADETHPTNTGHRLMAQIAEVCLIDNVQGT